MVQAEKAVHETLARRRCFHHPEREAAAVCPSCQRFFCRECVTEHQGRVLCKACLPADRPEKAGSGILSRLWVCLLFLVSLVGVWSAFYYLGSGLISLPDSFHQGTFWKELKP